MNANTETYFKDPRKILSVQPLDGYILRLTFDNGEVRDYNLSNELTGVYSCLIDKELFNTVFLDDVGNVAWNINPKINDSACLDNRIDLCKDALYMDSTPVQ